MKALSAEKEEALKREDEPEPVIDTEPAYQKAAYPINRKIITRFKIISALLNKNLGEFVKDEFDRTFDDEWFRRKKRELSKDSVI